MQGRTYCVPDRLAVENQFVPGGGRGGATWKIGGENERFKQGSVASVVDLKNTNIPKLGKWTAGLVVQTEQKMLYMCVARPGKRREEKIEANQHSGCEEYLDNIVQVDRKARRKKQV